MFFGLCVFPSFNNITKISLRSLIQLLILPLLLCTYSPCQYWSSLVAQMVKNQPAMQETWVRSLGWEDLLEKGISTGDFQGQRSLTGYSPWGHKESDTTERLSLSCQYSMIWTMIMWQTIPKFPELLSGVRSSLVLLAGTRILGFRSGMRVKNNYRACWKEEPKTAFLKKVSRTKVQFHIRNWRIKHGQK